MKRTNKNNFGFIKDKKGINNSMAILEFIKYAIEENGEAPTRYEIAERFNLRSQQAVRFHTDKLVKLNLIEIQPRVARGIVIINQD